MPGGGSTDNDTVKILLTVASVVVAFYFGTKTKERTEKTDYAQERIQVARIEGELRDISHDIQEIKSDISQMNAISGTYHIRQERAEKDLEELANRLKKVEAELSKFRDDFMKR